MTNDGLLELLARLPEAHPDADRSARVRARCRAVLVRPRKRSRPRPAPADRLWPAVVVLSGIYVAEGIRQALLLYGLL
jgi:hypothetical protein